MKALTSIAIVLTSLIGPQLTSSSAEAARLYIAIDRGGVGYRGHFGTGATPSKAIRNCRSKGRGSCKLSRKKYINSGQCTVLRWKRPGRRVVRRKVCN